MEVPIAKTCLDAFEEQAVLDVLRSGWIAQGPKVQEFEQIVGKYVGCQYARAVSSCTAGLHLALISCGIGPGDEVIVPAFTCIASVNPVEWLGAKPVFVDIELKTYGIDELLIEDAITRKTKAIMVVHLSGVCLDISTILSIARDHDLKVIEDAAPALGAFYDNTHAGTVGDVGVFSFHPRKVITTGEGGMVVSHNPDIIRDVEIRRNLGAEVTSWRRHTGGAFHSLVGFSRLGYNYRMTDIHASIGIEQMKKLPFLLERRKWIAKEYDSALVEVDQLVLPQSLEGEVHAYQSYVCLCVSRLGDLESSHQLRNMLMEKLAEKGIKTVQGAQSVPALAYYVEKYEFVGSDFSQAQIADLTSIALPIYPQMDEEVLRYVTDSIKEILAEGNS
jgi:dTDP-4-amino-4,6-dideoxygalactose transaminase